MKKHRIQLQNTEMAILNASAQIFSAYIATGQYEETDEKELSERAVKHAIAMAEHIDEVVTADEEIP